MSFGLSFLSSSLPCCRLSYKGDVFACLRAGLCLTGWKVFILEREASRNSIFYLPRMEDLEGKITSLNYAMEQHLNVQPIRDSPVHG